jgi:hypothetical protein
MMLILADEEDSLANAVYRHARRSSNDVLKCEDAAIASLDAEDPSSGALLCNGKRVPLNELDGVLFRLADRRSELLAGWYTLLWNLPCQVVNRFALSWWFDPAGYSAQLAEQLNAVLATAGSARGRRTDAATVMMIGAKFIAGGPGSRAVAQWLNGCAPALARWQRDTGVTLARLTLRGNRIVSLDPAPDFTGVSAELTEKVAAAVCSALLTRPDEETSRRLR